jgi:hypothetical protein
MSESKHPATESQRYWENRRNGEVIAYGPKETMPTVSEQKSMRDGGLKTYVQGKLFREEKKC